GLVLWGVFEVDALCFAHLDRAECLSSIRLRKRRSHTSTEHCMTVIFDERKNDFISLFALACL
ncbi:hypothetical protein, partial [Treponema socranskii]|uniref:hypothetical protein n=1 Tax=Treponema socranskii TaxID=53419 RepID=UPI003609D6DE